MVAILDCPTFLSCNGNHPVCKFLENLDLAYFIYLAQIASAYILAKAKVMKSGFERSYAYNKIA